MKTLVAFLAFASAGYFLIAGFWTGEMHCYFSMQL